MFLINGQDLTWLQWAVVQPECSRWVTHAIEIIYWPAQMRTDMYFGMPSTQHKKPIVSSPIIWWRLLWLGSFNFRFCIYKYIMYPYQAMPRPSWLATLWMLICIYYALNSNNRIYSMLYGIWSIEQYKACNLFLSTWGPDQVMLKLYGTFNNRFTYY